MKIFLNNHYFRLFSINKTELSIIDDLKKELTVELKNAFFSEKFKEGTWDGTKCFVSDKTNRVLTGLLPLVIKFLKLNEVQYEIIDERQNLPFNVSMPLKLFNGYELRDYQFDSVLKANNYIDDLFFPRGIFDLATNAGKNLVMSSITQSFNLPKTLICIHRKEIYSQCLEHFQTMFGEEVVGELDTMNKNVVTIAMYKTLLNKTKSSINYNKLLNEISLLFVDECHTAKSNDFTKLLLKINAGAVFFMSGTPISFENEELKIKTIGLSGKILKRVSNQTLIDKKVSLKPKIIMYKNEIGREWNDYQSNYEMNVKLSKNRANIIADYIEQNPTKQILISVNHLDHGRFLQKFIKQSKSINVEFVFSNHDLRKELLDSFKSGENRVLITSMILKEGVNIPNIQSLIFACGGKSVITVKQLIGRLIRNNGDNEEEVEVVDFFDTFKHLSSHSKIRMNIYKNEGFEIIQRY